MRYPRLFRAFVEWALPDLARHIDFNSFELVNKERFTFSGAKREGDVLIKTRLHGAETAFLFHLENQGQVQAGLPDRLLEYVVLDRRECGLEIYPIVVVTCHWPGARELSPLISEFPDKRVLYFDFTVVLLEELLAVEHLASRNPAALAMSGAMRMNQQERAILAVKFLELVAAVELNEEEREIVVAFFFGHLRLDAREQLQVRAELDKLDPMIKDEIMTLDNPFVAWGMEEGLEKGRAEGLQKGLAEGRQEGRQEGEAALVFRQLRKRFGSLGATHESFIKQLPLEKLEELGEALLEFKTVEQLDQWLRRM
jgi:hypothetical protein